jgi:hypothetical protein
VTLLRRRFERAKVEHDLPKDSDPAALARFVAVVVYGMAVLASGGGLFAIREEFPEDANHCGGNYGPSLIHSGRLHPTRLKGGQVRIVGSPPARMGRTCCESWRLASN